MFRLVETAIARAKRCHRSGSGGGGGCGSWSQLTADCCAARRTVVVATHLLQ